MKKNNPDQFDLFKKNNIPISEEEVGGVPLEPDVDPTPEDMAEYDKIMAKAEGGNSVVQKTRGQRETEKRQTREAIKKVKQKLGMADEQKDLFKEKNG